MKIRNILMVLISMGAGLQGQALFADTLTITVENIQSMEGRIMLRVMASQEEFENGSEAFTSIMQRASSETFTFVISNIPPGEYGIQVLHDENGNGEIDSNFAGMPVEPWAFSSNATGMFGPPTWDDFKFTLDGETSQTITLIH